MKNQRVRSARNLVSVTLLARCALSFSLLFFSSASLAQDFDTIIANGRIVDGSGNPWYEADVGIRGDRIVSIGDLSTKQAAQIIDATGLVVAPGFIDPHTHALARHFRCAHGGEFASAGRDYAYRGQRRQSPLFLLRPTTPKSKPSALVQTGPFLLDKARFAKRLSGATTETRHCSSLSA
jgi:hypothetical protein